MRVPLFRHVGGLFYDRIAFQPMRLRQKMFAENDLGGNYASGLDVGSVEGGGAGGCALQRRTGKGSSDTQGRPGGKTP